MELINDPKAMQTRSNKLRKNGKTIAFVPTMGALHEGHLSLVDVGKRSADIAVMSIYLNPKQFGPNEDISSYPSNLEMDLELARSRGVDIVFFPSDNAIYPEGFQTYVETSEIAKELCGSLRPNHFRGVTTVVLKLFNIVKPDFAIFGEKDFQQLKTIEQMVKDLDLDIEIIPAPIVREEDGLAMSSRNRYLTPDERLKARSINEALNLAKNIVKSGEQDLDKIVDCVRSHIESTDIAKIDYVKICDPETMEELTTLKTPALLAIAAHFGRARLIDNCILRSHVA